MVERRKREEVNDDAADDIEAKERHSIEKKKKTQNARILLLCEQLEIPHARPCSGEARLDGRRQPARLELVGGRRRGEPGRVGRGVAECDGELRREHHPFVIFLLEPSCPSSCAKLRLSHCVTCSVSSALAAPPGRGRRRGVHEEREERKEK